MKQFVWRSAMTGLLTLVALTGSTRAQDPAKQIQVGGPDFTLALELSGGPVVRRTVTSPPFVPFPPRTVTIAPGESAVLPVVRLASVESL